MKKRLHLRIVFMSLTGFAFLFESAQVCLANISGNPQGKPAADSIYNYKMRYPRMTTAERNALYPAYYIIFNNDSNSYERNVGTPAKPEWKTTPPGEIFFEF